MNENEEKILVPSVSPGNYFNNVGETEIGTAVIKQYLWMMEMKLNPLELWNTYTHERPL